MLLRLDRQGRALPIKSSFPLKRFPVEMNRDDKLLAVYPPHPEEGASTCTSEKRNRCVAPVSKDGRPHGSRRRARGCGMPGRPKIAAPHHEAERGRECIKLIGIRFSGATRLSLVIPNVRQGAERRPCRLMSLGAKRPKWLSPRRSGIVGSDSTFRPPAG